MKMVYKLSIAAIVLLTVVLFALPAAAQFGCGPGGPGLGMPGSFGSPYGGAAVAGPPQDCIAQVSCNVPVVTEVPTLTATVVPQQVPVVTATIQQAPVTVPRVVVVPETVPVPYLQPVVSSTTVPVTVPVPTSVPVVSNVPQVFTVPLGSMGAAKGIPAGKGIPAQANAPALGNAPATSGAPAKAANVPMSQPMAGNLGPRPAAANTGMGARVAGAPAYGQTGAMGSIQSALMSSLASACPSCA